MDMANGAAYPLSELSENWSALAWRGVAGVVFGMLAFLLPIATVTALVWLFGAYAFFDGVFNLVAVWQQSKKPRHARTRPWWSLLIQGIVGVAVGVISFIWPGITAIALVIMVAAWAFVTGVLGIISAVRLRKEIKGEWLLALSGVLSVALGVLLAVAPGPGAVALVWYLGAYAIVSGALLLGLSFRLRSRYEETKAQRAGAAA
jgi:uncharacterized membrane protein HdeD (DUF308 family)